MKRRVSVLLAIPVLALGALPLGFRGLVAQEAGIQSGPMVGWGDMREVRLWVQTTGSARVQFRYYHAVDPGHVWNTTTVTTRAEAAFTAEIPADSVEPGRQYAYEVWVDGRRIGRPYPLLFKTPPLWQWRTNPPQFTVAVASCFYVNEPAYDRPGAPYGSDFQILSAIAERHADLMLWLGDDTYLREADWWTRTGILHRYTHTRSLPELQPVLGSMHHIAIWDDHDYGPNDSDRAYVGKAWTREAFDLFWPNPPAVADLDGITTMFQWGDVQFFLLDDRWYRSPNDRKTGEREVLGGRQLQWLIDALASSAATFKIVAMGGQVLSPTAEFENYATYPEERARMLEAIQAEGIPGVVFLTGDRHFTELTRLERSGAYPLYDLTVSPLTAGLATPNAANELRVDGTYVLEHNFGLLTFDGPRDDRRLTMTIVGPDGAERWSRTIRASELR